jgi:transcriptional regulator with XRE-family HTH domain
MQLGTLIKRYRERADLSQRALGEAVGVSATAIHAWETGTTIPDRSRVATLAAVLRIGEPGYAALERAAQIDAVSKGAVNAPAA